MAWLLWASQVALGVKNSPADTGDIRDVGWIPGSGRCPGGGQGSSLQYSCLENPMDRGAWWTVHGVSQSRTRLKQLSTHTHEPFLFTSTAELWLGWLFSLDFLHKYPSSADLTGWIGVGNGPRVCPASTGSPLRLLWAPSILFPAVSKRQPPSRFGLRQQDAGEPLLPATDIHPFFPCLLAEDCHDPIDENHRECFGGSPIFTSCLPTGLSGGNLATWQLPLLEEPASLWALCRWLERFQCRTAVLARASDERLWLPFSHNIWENNLTGP